MKFTSGSWKTSMAGIVTAIGGTIVAYDHMHPDALSHNTILLGLILTAAGPLLAGLFARDNDKSSEDVGASGRAIVQTPTPVTIVPAPPTTPTPEPPKTIQ